MNCKNNWLRGCVLFTLAIGISSLTFAKSVAPENYIDGVWFVGLHEVNGGASQIGTLIISGDTYSYEPIREAEVPLWMSERFSFIDAQTGSVEYELSILSEDRIENLEDNTTFAQLSFSGSDEVFLVRVDRDSEQLYFHAQVSEFQLYEISKDYGDCSSE